VKLHNPSCTSKVQPTELVGGKNENGPSLRKIIAKSLDTHRESYSSPRVSPMETFEPLDLSNDWMKATSQHILIGLP
jgi:hypothetical protein